MGAGEFKKENSTMGDETENQGDDVQQYTHDGAVDYAEMAGLGQTHYDQTPEHEGDGVHIHHDSHGDISIDTQHGDGSYSHEYINADPHHGQLVYSDTEWGSDHSVSTHALSMVATLDSRSAHGIVDHEEAYNWHVGEHETFDPHEEIGAEEATFEADELADL
jgi:hypothetical protein